MSYVDGILDRAKDRIHIVERDKNGNRVFKDYAAEYVLYYDDPKGKFQTIYRTPVSRFTTHSSNTFRKEVKMHDPKKIWEHDINPIFRCLETYYSDSDSPKLHTVFFDIETDWDEEQGGYAPVDNPFNKITAISLYLDWMDKLVTLAIPPKTISWESALAIAEKFEDTYMFREESDMLDTFLTLIEDADVLSGWNSEGYDIPYTVGRIIRVLSKDDLRRMCLWGQMPKSRTYERYGAENITYDLVGRVHLDYMQLYQQYTYEERHSYSLDSIGEFELGECKVAYEGTLDQLYNQDFYKFIDYNRQDTRLLARLDQKLQFLDLANGLAHDNTVLLATTQGAVAITDQAITNEAHRRGFIVPSRKPMERKPEASLPKKKRKYDPDDDGESESIGDGKAAGAYVAHPKVGMHRDIGAIDINSLYPSTIRALNMCPETIVGQLRPIMTDQYVAEKMADKIVKGKVVKGLNFPGAWEGLFGTLEYSAVMNMEKGTEITIDWETGDTTTHTADEVYKIIFESGQPWMISANGTIFTYEYEGIIPGLLARWYSERKQLQAKKKEATEKEEIAFWDKRQLVKKINLNSLYGALLNPGCRFHDFRIGQSTTLTGRTIAKHMDSFVNEYLTGKYQYDGETIVYGDTDSVYFSAWPVIKEAVESGKMEWNKDICIQLYDTIADEVNKSFPAMMEKSCHCPLERGAIIKGGRELVASAGLFIKKKRYAVLITDMEGNRLDKLDEAAAKKKGVVFGVGKVKAMGLDLKRSDTPKIVQDFLSDILLKTLTHESKESIIQEIIKFKRQFAEMKPWEKGTPKRVNNLTAYSAKAARLAAGKGGDERSGMPGHVSAAITWNKLRELNSDNYSTKITDGAKVIVCKLKANPMGFSSCAYPIDIAHIPNWFKDLPFDNELMEETIVNKKLENLLGVLKWDITIDTEIKTSFNSLFSFD